MLLCGQVPAGVSDGIACRYNRRIMNGRVHIVLAIATLSLVVFLTAGCTPRIFVDPVAAMTDPDFTIREQRRKLRN